MNGSWFFSHVAECKGEGSVGKDLFYLYVSVKIMSTKIKCKW